MAITPVVSATLGAMAAIVDGDAVEQHDSLVTDMVLLAPGVTAAKARRIAYLPLPELPADGAP